MIALVCPPVHGHAPALEQHGLATTLPDERNELQTGCGEQGGCRCAARGARLAHTVCLRSSG
eukprot:2845783-Prymnesium_polylepis.1